MKAVGSRVPIVLIPSLGGSARLFASQLPPLWRRGPVTIADHTADDSIPAIARRILASAPPRFALAGLSMGGYVAFEIMRQANERVLRLALLDTSARIDTRAERADREKQRALARTGDFRSIAPSQFKHVVHASRRGSAALQRCFRRMLDETGAAAFVRQQTACIDRADSLATLADIRCPTLILVGANDAITPPGHARQMAAGIAGGTVVTVPRCGHLATIDQPRAVTRALLDWLAPAA